VDTEHPRIRRVERRTEAAYDLEALLGELKPICRFDPAIARSIGTGARSARSCGGRSRRL
jgi:hypothetical protein